MWPESASKRCKFGGKICQSSRDKESSLGNYCFYVPCRLVKMASLDTGFLLLC